MAMLLTHKRRKIIDRMKIDYPPSIKMRPKETLINSANEMKHEAHGTQQPRHINMIGEGASTAQRSDSLVQSINQRFPRNQFLMFNQLR